MSTKEYRLPEHIRAIHDAIAKHPNLVVLANGTGGVFFKGYPRSEVDDPADKHFIRVHESLFRGGGGPNSGCLIIHNESKLGNALASKVRACFGPICTSMPVDGDNASFLSDTRLAEIVTAIASLGDMA
jgi:hypothetical protein